LAKEEICEREKQDDLARWQRYRNTSEHHPHDEIRTRLTHLADQAHAKTAK